MAAIEEIPPIMVLEENTGFRMVFRFRGRVWGWSMLAIGLAILGGFGRYQLSHHNLPWEIWLFDIFGALLIYSSIYSFTADQYLVVNGTDRTIHFHKRNLYGRLDWERPGSEFKEIRVCRARTTRGQAMNWSIALVVADGRELYLGENEFGSFSRDGAVALAENVSRLTGIPVHAAES